LAIAAGSMAPNRPPTLSFKVLGTWMIWPGFCWLTTRLLETLVQQSLKRIR